MEALIESFNAAQWVFYTLVFAGLLIMRVTYRHEKRLFKVRRRLWLHVAVVKGSRWEWIQHIVAFCICRCG